MIDSADAAQVRTSRRLVSTPGFAALAATFGMVLVALSFYVSLPGTFPPVPGGAAPAPGMPARCLVVAPPPPGGHRWFRDEIRLLPAKYASADGGWYHAVDRRGRQLAWRPAGPDSFDVLGSDGPVLRLPARGTHLVGRGGWTSYANVWDALASRGWVAEASVVPCSFEPREPRW